MIKLGSWYSIDARLYHTDTQHELTNALSLYDTIMQRSHIKRRRLPVHPNNMLWLVLSNEEIWNNSWNTSLHMHFVQKHIDYWWGKKQGSLYLLTWYAIYLNLSMQSLIYFIATDGFKLNSTYQRQSEFTLRRLRHTEALRYI